MANYRLSEDLNGVVPVERQKGGVPDGVNAPMPKWYLNIWHGALFTRHFTRLSRNTVEEEFGPYDRGGLASCYAPTIDEDPIASGIQQD
jgi:hypothetical protein